MKMAHWAVVKCSENGQSRPLCAMCIYYYRTRLGASALYAADKNSHVAAATVDLHTADPPFQYFMAHTFCLHCCTCVPKFTIGKTLRSANSLEILSCSCTRQTHPFQLNVLRLFFRKFYLRLRLAMSIFTGISPRWNFSPEFIWNDRGLQF